MIQHVWALGFREVSMMGIFKGREYRTRIQFLTRSRQLYTRRPCDIRPQLASAPAFEGGGRPLPDHGGGCA
jgi:hypothetical protein